MKNEVVYQKVTDKIIEMLKGGKIPWHKSWTGFAPMNLISKKAYRGVNHILLAFMEYANPYWLTYGQARDEAVRQAKLQGRNIEQRNRKRGKGIYYWDVDNDCVFEGGVKKGEKGTMIIFWKMLKISTKEPNPNTNTTKSDKIPLLRYYTVFNGEQCSGIQYPSTDFPDNSPIERCEGVVDGYEDCPEIRGSMDRCFYHPMEDFIGIPSIKQFSTSEDYYSVLFHELTHSTGHASRLNREGVIGGHYYKSTEYSKEELVAELGASFLCSIAGIDNQASILKNSAGYLQGWLKALEEDNTLIVRASSKAQQAVDYIVGENKEEVK